ncbi:MAG: hypothetical protein FJY67_03970 [Calditrichaeota bacterium]|nr:hypothetical protein [Calditrichota bacterium]
MKSNLLREGAVWLGYGTLAMLFTWPLVTGLDQQLSGRGGDAYAIYWVVWWTGQALRMGVSPFSSPLIYHPLGTDLSPEPFPFGLAHYLLSQLFPALSAFNVLYLLQFPFAAWGAYRLALHLWGNRSGALLAGLIYGFGPYMMIRGTGHLSLMTNGFFPLALLTIFRAIVAERVIPRQMVAAGLMLTLACLTSTYHAIFLFLYCLALTFYLLRVERSPGGAGRLLGIGAVTSIMLIPWGLKFLSATATGYYRATGMLGQAWLGSVDLLGILAPPALHPIYGEGARRWFGIIGSGGIERTAYTGVIVLCLAILGARCLRSDRWGRWVLLSTIGAWVMSLGPFLQVVGRMTYIPLPGFVMAVTPVLQHARAPGRWTILTILGIALLAAGGVKWLQERTRPGRCRLYLAAIVLLTLFEYWPSPYPVADATVPGLLSRLPIDERHPALLDLPLGRIDGLTGRGRFEARHMLFQTVHRRPILSGYVSRARPEHFAQLEAGLPGAIVAAQSAVALQERPRNRGEGLKGQVRRWAGEGGMVAKALRFLIGEAKLQDILDSDKSSLTARDTLMLEPVNALIEADRLGLGLVIVADTTDPAAAAGLGFVRSVLPLREIGSEGLTLVLGIDYYRGNPLGETPSVPAQSGRH